MMLNIKNMTDCLKEPTPIQVGLALFMCLCGWLACGSSPSSVRVSNSDLNYNLDQPGTVITITDDNLKEISGLSPTDQPSVFCALADEKGMVFFVDVAQGGSITRRVAFANDGDFEGVEMVDRTLWAVTSKGKLFKITDWEKEGQTPVVATFDLGLSKENDIEGLCYHPTQKILLVACKEDPEQNVPRHIWGVDTGTGQRRSVPAYTIQPDAVDRLVPHDSDDKKRFFSTSGIAVHPQTNELYVISSALKRLIVLDSSGQIKHGVRLNKKVLPQPEGIAFDSKGNLIISSEGKNEEQGQILIFGQKK
jgi:uncharacterized protein YjiK